MSQADNPYAARNVSQTPGQGATPAPTMDYVRGYSYVFESAAWVPNIFFTALCQLIPVVGPIVVLGYQFEIVEALHRDPRRIYPDFDWNKFVQYLTRGVWPFLMALIIAAVAAPIALIGWFGIMMVGGLLLGEGGDAGAVAGLFMLGGGFLMIFLFMVAIQFVATSFQIRAGLSQDFATSFNFGWVRDFLGRVWLEMLLALLFLGITALVLTFLGLMAFCVGVYVAMAWVMLAQSQIYFQLYRLYLARGGEEVPLKPQPAVPGAMPG